MMSPEKRVPEGRQGAAQAQADDLPGTVMMIKDSCWGFRAAGRFEHPGACVVGSVPKRLQSVFVKGSDARRYRPDAHTAVVVEPSISNGLDKRTAFSLAPHFFDTHKVEQWVRVKTLGRLDPDDLMRLQIALYEAFPATIRP